MERNLLIMVRMICYSYALAEEKSITPFEAMAELFGAVQAAKEAEET